MSTGEQLQEKILLSKTVQWQYKLDNFTDASLKEILKSLSIAKRNLLDTISKKDIALPPGREELVLNELNKLTLGVQDKLTGDIAKVTEIAGQSSFKAYNEIISYDGLLSAKDGFTFVRMSPDQLHSAVVSTPVGGKILKKWVSDSFTGKIVTDIKDDVTAGLMEGASTKALSNRLQDSFNMLERDAITLTRTYVSSINNNAAGAVYKANSNIIDQEEWSATLEVSAKEGYGTCMQCTLLDGKKWDIDSDHPRPPAHHRCRCFMLPVTKSYKDLGLDIPELEALERTYGIHEGIPIDAGGKRKILDYGQFKGNALELIQSKGSVYLKNVIGPTRKGLIDDGVLNFSDLLDNDGQVVLLKDLPEGK